MADLVNESRMAEMYGGSRQAGPWHQKSYGGRLTTRLRDHGEYMRVGGFDTMSEDKEKHLKAWWTMLRDDDAVLEFDPTIQPYPGMAGGGFRYAKRALMPLPELGALFPDRSNPAPGRARLAAAG